jgi:lactate dehydrogenase-like 2-hydroxyacid dehydrogenase
MSIVVLVTETEYRRAESTFGATAGFDCRAVPAPEDELSKAVEQHGARAVVVGGTSYRDRLYTTLGAGGVIARFGVGFDSIDRARATEAGVLCTNTPDVLQQSVAELTMTMIGAAARHVLAVAGDLRSGRWNPREGTELEAKTLALVGCGAIAQAVARIASAGFGMRVVGYSRRPRTALTHFAAITTDFADAVRGADFVSLHIPASAENAHFVDAARLSLLAPHAWLINTARGAVVDERALFDALSGGRLAGAALDVFEREPYQPADAARDLRTLDNVIPVPHIGSNTVEANRRMALRALRNVQLAHDGDVEAMDLINRDVLSRR